MQRILTALLFSVVALTASALNGPVTLDSGVIESGPLLAGGVRVYRGIPYAAAPTGELRWKSPQPVNAWQGGRDGSIFAPVCMQGPGQGYQNIAIMQGSPAMSEDCLYLNVWSGAATVQENRPVMVWFHGGGFTDGAGSVPLYDGQKLAQMGVVVVTINYRLGPFGFLVHPALSAESDQQSSGNYGLMDMLESLRWVQNNIAAFGGNPANVTVFGQSAGAMAISALLTSPMSEGLMHRVITQSGAWMGLGPDLMTTLGQAELQTIMQTSNADIGTTEDLRALSAEEVQASLRGSGMIVDGWVLPRDPLIAYANGEQLAVDVLAGSNQDEGSFIPAGPDAEQWRAQLQEDWAEDADSMLQVYPADNDAAARRSSQQAFSDAAAWHMRLFAAYQARLGKQAWVYHFRHQPPVDAGQPDRGAAHSSELPYVFNNLDQARLFPDSSSPSQARQSAKDQQLADLMSAYWVNFAYSGNPNSSVQASWPQYLNLNSRVMMFDEEPKVETQVNALLWHRYNQRYQRLIDQLVW